MIIVKPMVTERQMVRKQKREAKKEARKAKKENWHRKFVIYRRMENWGKSEAIHVWFRTMERKGRLVYFDDNELYSYWTWTYRIPQNEEVTK